MTMRLGLSVRNHLTQAPRLQYYCCEGSNLPSSLRKITIFSMQKLPQSSMNSACILRGLCGETTRITHEFAWEYLWFSCKFPVQFMGRKKNKKKEKKLFFAFTDCL